MPAKSPEDIIQALYDAAQNGLRVSVVSGGGGGDASEATLLALLALMMPGVPEHRVGTVGTTPQQITFSGPTKFIIVQNIAKEEYLEVSFDGGSTYMVVISGGQIALPCRITGLYVRSSVGSSGYEILATV
ncbi:MAG: hypothetical protein E3J72_11920 [Planctomycetota bacterium]|nr:MAG: hypothetical protein E3J72_11920 [Planctomycetota bacterium]